LRSAGARDYLEMRSYKHRAPPEHIVAGSLILISLCNLCVLCVSVVVVFELNHHRDTEDTSEVAKRQGEISHRLPRNELDSFEG
jgi:hypothetical protein